MNTRWLRLAMVALAAGVAGCVTWPGRLQDPQVGYLVKGYQAAARGVAGARAEQERYAGLVAEEQLGKLTRPPATTLPPIRAFLATLKKPLDIDPAVLDKAAELTAVPPGERSQLQAWVAADPTRRQIDGAKASPKWAAAIADAEKAIAALEGRVRDLAKQAADAAAAKNFQAAIDLAGEAMKLDPADTRLAGQFDEYGRGWLNLVVDQALQALTAGELAQAGQLEAEQYGKKKADPEKIKECLALLDAAQGKLDQIRAFGQSNAVCAKALAGREPDLQKAEARVAQLKGKSWGEAMWLVANEDKHWRVYGYLQERLKDAAKQPGHRAAAVRAELLNAYSGLLPKAMGFYVGKANEYFAQDFFGLSLALCRMAEELDDFAQREKVPLVPEAKEWEGRMRSSLQDARERLKTRLARRLVVNDFTADGKEGRTLAQLVHDEWLRRYKGQGAAPGPFWSVQVLRGGPPPEKADYVVDGSVRMLSVAPLSPEELQREVIKIGRDVAQVPNPDYKQGKGGAPVVFAQEVFMFQCTTVKQGKQAHLKAEITLTHADAKTALASLDAQFPGAASLAGVTLTGTARSVDAPFMGAPRLSDSQEGLKPDEWPKSTVANLSADDDIRAAMLDYARDQILARLETTMAAAPLNDLLAEGLRQQKLGKPPEAANQMGQCLEYCCMMIGPGAESGGWSALKDAMLKQVAALNATIWKEQDPELQRKIADLWDNTVAAVQAVLGG